MNIFTGGIAAFLILCAVLAPLHALGLFFQLLWAIFWVPAMLVIGLTS